MSSLKSRKTEPVDYELCKRMIMSITPDHMKGQTAIQMHLGGDCPSAAFQATLRTFNDMREVGDPNYNALSVHYGIMAGIFMAFATQEPGFRLTVEEVSKQVEEHEAKEAMQDGKQSSPHYH